MRGKAKMQPIESALIVGAGFGLSASLAKLFKKEGMKIALASRNVEKLKPIANEIDALCIKCDAASVKDVNSMFEQVEEALGTPAVVIYNPSARIRGGIETLNPLDTKAALDITCFGAFLVAQQAAIKMLKRGSGSIFFTGASAGVKGFANSSVFAMGKFGLRGLAQSLARELHPKNIHVGHFVIDGGIKSQNRPDNGDCTLLCPDEIAKAYLNFHKQKKSIWSWEIELRPWVEKF